MKIKNKKVLVTGADGFIGSHLVDGLLKAGADVRAFCYYNSFGHLGWLDSFSKEKLGKLDIFMGDIRDPHGVKTSMEGIDIVFHLAALIGIPYSYYSPSQYVETNIKGTLNILQAARELKTKKILVTSTSEVYGTALYTPIDEKHPRQGQSPYSATKIAADSLSESFYRSFNLPVAIVRPFNTYGPRQSTRAVIPTIITQLLAGKTKIDLGNLTPKRDFVFVEDTVAAFLTIAESGNVCGREMNIATGKGISIEELSETLIRLINPKAAVVKDGKRLRPAKSEVFHLLGSNAVIKELTGWRPRYSLDHGLQKTIEWFRQKENLKLYKVNQYSI